MKDKNTHTTICLGGFGDINFGNQYKPGNRIYDSRGIAMGLMSQPTGQTAGWNYLYVIYEDGGLNFEQNGTKGVGLNK